MIRKLKKAFCLKKEETRVKPDYKNWMPKGMVAAGFILTAVLLALFIIFGLTGIVHGAVKTILSVVFLAGAVFCFGLSVWMLLMFRAFSYNGKRQMSKRIIEGIADCVKLPSGAFRCRCGHRHRKRRAYRP